MPLFRKYKEKRHFFGMEFSYGRNTKKGILLWWVVEKTSGKLVCGKDRNVCSIYRLSSGFGTSLSCEM